MDYNVVKVLISEFNIMADPREAGIVRKQALDFARKIGFRVEENEDKTLLYDGAEPLDEIVLSEFLDISQQFTTSIASRLLQSFTEGKHIRIPELSTFALIKWTFDLSDESLQNKMNPPNFDRYYTLKLLLEHITAHSE